MKRIMKWVRKRIFLSILIVLLIGSSVAVLGYWAGAFTIVPAENVEGTINIGEGDTVTTTVNVADVSGVGPLVPVGISGVNNADLIFNVEWNGVGATGAIGTLLVTVDSIEVNEANFSHLFTVNTSLQPTIIAGTMLPYTVNVEFTNEPADLTEYNLVAKETLTITLTFTVDPN